MARLTMAEKSGSDSDELPSLNDLLQRPVAKSRTAATRIRQARSKPKNAMEHTEDLESANPSSFTIPKISQPVENGKVAQKQSRRGRPNGSSKLSSSSQSMEGLGTATSTSRQQKTSQRQLKVTVANPLLLPFENSKVKKEFDTEEDGAIHGLGASKSDSPPAKKENQPRTRPNPVRKAKQAPKYTYKGYQSNSEDEDEFTDLSGFVVDDDAELSFHNWNSDSEASTPPKEAPKPRRRLVRGRDMKKANNDLDKVTSQLEGLGLNESHEESKPVSLGDSNTSDEPEELSEKKSTQNIPDLSSDILENQQLAILKFSPPRSRSPFKIPSKPSSQLDEMSPFDPPVGTGFTTPPASPSKPKLNSPSKSRAQQIPTSPHHQSMDAFWASDVINEWNDSYSPQKPPMTSPRKGGMAKFLIYSDEENDKSSSEISSPTNSPKSNRDTKTGKPGNEQQSAAKLKKALQEEKKAAKAAQAAFEASKQKVAVDFLAALDERITSGKLAILSKSTGGVNIVWSNTLRSTAGRANWRRVIKTHDSTSAPQIQHFATIELASKVITTRTRLLNTMAHEFCHLANFMVSGIKDQPHGASFKAWAAKVTKEFAKDAEYNEIEVTTKHDYAIEWKYIWVCGGEAAKSDATANKHSSDDNGDNKFLEALLERLGDDGCGTEYGRHSKSIDPQKHRCGKCKGGLVQVKPKPRKVASSRGAAAAAAAASTGTGAKKGQARTRSKQQEPQQQQQEKKNMQGYDPLELLKQVSANLDAKDDDNDNNDLSENDVQDLELDPVDKLVARIETVELD